MFFHHQIGTGPYAAQPGYDQGGPFWQRGSGLLNAKDTGIVHYAFAQLTVIVLPALSLGETSPSLKGTDTLRNKRTRQARGAWRVLLGMDLQKMNFAPSCIMRPGAAIVSAPNDGSDRPQSGLHPPPALGPVKGT